MKDIVKAMLLRGTNVLLARRSSERRNYPDRWSFPGGHVETGEALDDALMRELQEEIGLTPLVFRKIGGITEPDPSINSDVLYHSTL
jgi:8-oxo-dGTP diphosphatase